MPYTNNTGKWMRSAFFNAATVLFFLRRRGAHRGLKVVREVSGGGGLVEGVREVSGREEAVGPPAHVWGVSTDFIYRHIFSLQRSPSAMR